MYPKQIVHKRLKQWLKASFNNKAKEVNYIYGCQKEQSQQLL